VASTGPRLGTAGNGSSGITARLQVQEAGGGGMGEIKGGEPTNPQKELKEKLLSPEHTNGQDKT
jgi:hypothetical protein